MIINKAATSLFSFINKKFVKGEVPLEEIYYNLKYENPPTPYKIIKINPKDVNFLTIPRFEYSLYKNYTHVVDGDWDKRILDKKIDFLYENQGKEYFLPRWERNSLKRYLLPFDKYTYYTSSKKHFKEGTPWEETEIYQFFIDKIKEGVMITRFETKEEIDKQLSFFDSLYENIKRYGYKSQLELQRNKKIYLKWVNSHPSRKETRINIGRNGEMFFDDGRHRFIIAKILGLDEIPARVFVRHEKWQEIRDEYKREEIDLDHPDLG